MTKLRYVLYVEPEEETTLISVHSTKAAAEAELRKFAAEFLDAQVPLVGCRIFECPADGRPGAEVLVGAAINLNAAQAGRGAREQRRSSSARSRHKENRMATNYLLYIEYECGSTGVSVWPSIADVEANLGGLTGDLLKPGNPFPPPAASFAAGLMKIGIIDCRIIECAADGSTSVWFNPFTTSAR